MLYDRLAMWPQCRPRQSIKDSTGLIQVSMTKDTRFTAKDQIRTESKNQRDQERETKDRDTEIHEEQLGNLYLIRGIIIVEIRHIYLEIHI